VICEVAVGGTTGEVLAIALMSLGFGGAVLLVFYEVGLSEDRDRAREAARRREQEVAQLRERDEAQRRERNEAERPEARPRSRPQGPRWRRRP
jgi:hypothetical protein